MFFFIYLCLFLLVFFYFFFYFISSFSNINSEKIFLIASGLMPITNIATKQFLSAELIATRSQLIESLLPQRIAPTPQLDSAGSSFWQYFQTPSSSSSVSELEQFNNIPQGSHSATIHSVPLFWNSHRTQFPQLYEVALQIFCHVSHQLSCERIFSQASYVSTKARNRLSPKLVDVFVRTKSNLKLFQ